MNVVLAGRYELDQRLGRGGMAEVWRGRDLVLGRRIAVKTVSVADATDLTLGDRLRREAVATAALDHPDIVTVHDAGVDGDIAFLVMELVSGRTLAALLADRPLPLPEAVRVAGRVAGALGAAHAAGIVHRDIKPANIIVDGEKVTVVDFGIAAIEFQAVTSLTAPGTTLGTAEYMAPEQARAEPASSGTDMYSFGCLLTTLVAGRPPFTAQSPVAVLHHHAYIQPPRLRRLRPDVPAELDALVGALLDKDPGARPSAAEAHERLARIAETLTPAKPSASGLAGPTTVAAAGVPGQVPAVSAGPAAGTGSAPPTAAGPAVPAPTSEAVVPAPTAASPTPPTVGASPAMPAPTAAESVVPAPTARTLEGLDRITGTARLDEVSTAILAGVATPTPAAAAGTVGGRTTAYVPAAPVAPTPEEPVDVVPVPRRRRVLVGALAAVAAGVVGVSVTAAGSPSSEPIGKVLVANSAQKVTVVTPDAVVDPVEAPVATALPAPPATDEGEQQAEENNQPAPEEERPAVTGKGQNGKAGPGQNNGVTGKGEGHVPGRGNGGKGNG